MKPAHNCSYSTPSHVLSDVRPQTLCTVTTDHTLEISMALIFLSYAYLWAQALKMNYGISKVGYGYQDMAQVKQTPYIFLEGCTMTVGTKRTMEYGIAELAYCIYWPGPINACSHPWTSIYG